MRRIAAKPILLALLGIAVLVNLGAFLMGRYDTPRPPAVPPAPIATEAALLRPAAAPAPSPTPTPVSTGYRIKRVLPIAEPLRYGKLYWDDAGVPDGPVVITIDIGARVLSIFRGGYEIGTSAVIYGADEYPTPLGVYTILQKDRHHRSNIYGGAPMPYGLRLTQDGVFIHGSPGADARYMTHGCIGLPMNFAAKLFDAVRKGDRVIVTRGETLKQGDPIPAA